MEQCLSHLGQRSPGTSRGFYGRVYTENTIMREVCSFVWLVTSFLRSHPKRGFRSFAFASRRTFLGSVWVVRGESIFFCRGSLNGILFLELTELCIDVVQDMYCLLDWGGIIFIYCLYDEWNQIHGSRMYNCCYFHWGLEWESKENMWNNDS